MADEDKAKLKDIVISAIILILSLVVFIVGVVMGLNEELWWGEGSKAGWRIAIGAGIVAAVSVVYLVVRIIQYRKAE